MKKCLDLYLTTPEIDIKDRLKCIKETGYDGIFVSMNDSKESLKIEEQIKMARDLGLDISMIHSSYNESLLNSFWEEGETGDYVEKDIIKQINKIKNFKVKNFIFHTNGNREAKNTEIGINRINRILKICEKFDINLNIENLHLEEQVDYIFNNIKHKNLTFCFDCGHKNFLTKNADYISKYKDRTTTVHLHDNHGEKDEHNVLGNGSIYLEDLAKDLAKLDRNVALSSEMRTSVEKFSKELLVQNLCTLNNLEKMIDKYRNI